MSPMSPQPEGMRRTRREAVKRDEHDEVIRTDEWNILLRLGRGKRGKWVTIGWTERVHPDTATRGGWRGYPSDHTFPQERANHNDVMLWMREVYLKAHPQEDAAKSDQPADEGKPVSPLARKRKPAARNQQPAIIGETAAENRQLADVAEHAADPDLPAEPEQPAATSPEPATSPESSASTGELAVDSQPAEVEIVVIQETAAEVDEPATVLEPSSQKRDDSQGVADEPWEYPEPEGNPELKLVLQPDPFEGDDDPFGDPFA